MGPFLNLTQMERGVGGIVEYIERLTFYFMANGITENPKQKAILLSNTGKTCYHLIKNLASPNELCAAVMTFKTIKTCQENMCHPRPTPSLSDSGFMEGLKAMERALHSTCWSCTDCQGTAVLGTNLANRFEIDPCVE